MEKELVIIPFSSLTITLLLSLPLSLCLSLYSLFFIFFNLQIQSSVCYYESLWNLNDCAIGLIP